MGGAELDRDRKIGAHAHRQVLQPVARGDLRGQREMRRRRIVDRRNAHQAGNFQPIFSRQLAMKASASAGATPAFCGSSPVLSWTNNSGRRFCELISLANASQMLGPVDRMDGVEQRHRLFGLVGLQRPDQMQYRTRVSSALTQPASPWLPCRFSPNIRCPASMITGVIANASNVFGYCDQLYRLAETALPGKRARISTARTVARPLA